MDFPSSPDAAPPHSLFPLFADKHKDGTAIIMELEKGLRSTKIGEQCESIAFFARLIAQYPFVVVVNTAVLKLSDLFRQSNNFVRFCILRVFQSCEEQLIPGNILNLDEVLRRTTSVLHSNDPIARALTLRLLSSLSLLIADRLDIQHWIRKCFDSQHALETDATLCLMDRVAACSESFCIALLHKALESIDALETPMATKLRLMRVFRHMHHSSSLAHDAETRCVELLRVHTLRSCTITLMESLTTLAEHVPALAPRQVARLLDLVANDPRRIVQLRVLVCLARLARRPRGVFPLPTERLWTLIDSSPYAAIRLNAALVLSALASAAADEFFTLQDVLRYSPLLHNSHADLTNALAHVLSVVATHPAFAGATPPPLASAAASTLSAQLCLIISLRSVQSNVPLPCAALLRLLKTHSTCRPAAVKVLLPLTVAANPSAPSITRLLASVATIDSNVAAQVAASVPQLLLLMQTPTSTTTHTSHLQELLLRSFPLPSDLSSSLLPLVEKAGGWATYALGRKALCCSAPALAADAFHAVAERAGNEQHLSWLLALRDFARAEVRAQSPQGTGAALSDLATAITHLHGAAHPAAPMIFQTKFIAYRRSFLSAIASLRLLLQEVPRLPVLLYPVHDARLRAATERITAARRLFADLATEATQLAYSQFDIDPSSGAALQSHAQVCNTISALVRIWFEPSEAGAALPQFSNGNHLPLASLCTRLLSEASTVPSDISARADALLEALQLLCSHTPPYPRFFFRGSTGTQLKLTISPRPPSHSEALLVQSSLTVVLRISGVLQLASHVRRHAQRVSIAVRVTEVAQGLKLKNLRLDHIRGTEISQHTLRVRLRHQAFSTSCLLRFPTAGRTYLVTLQPAIIAGGEEWSAQTEALFVRTLEPLALPSLGPITNIPAIVIPEKK